MLEPDRRPSSNVGEMLEEIRILRDETRSAADKGDALNRLEALIRQ